MKLTVAIIPLLLFLATEAFGESTRIHAKEDQKTAVLGIDDRFRCFELNEFDSEAEPRRRCYEKKVSFQPVSLRENWKWTIETAPANTPEGQRIRNIFYLMYQRFFQYSDPKSDAAKASGKQDWTKPVIQGARDFTIQNLAVADSSFVVDIAFSYGNDFNQYQYIFGEIKPGSNGQNSIEIQYYADVMPGKIGIRKTIKGFENRIYVNRNKNEVDTQVDKEDQIRAQSVEPIIADWILTMGGLIATRMASRTHKALIEVSDAKRRE